ncbi:LOW QUALITY PROTEIN: conserved hypothetical protein, partial [Neisseria gonorrhoeae PID18]
FIPLQNQHTVGNAKNIFQFVETCTPQKIGKYRPGLNGAPHIPMPSLRYLPASAEMPGNNIHPAKSETTHPVAGRVKPPRKASAIRKTNRLRGLHPKGRIVR